MGQNKVMEMVNNMLGKILKIFSFSKIWRIALILLVVLLLVFALLFRSEINNFFLKFKSYTNNSILVTKDILLRDISIIEAKEGVQGQVLLLRNDRKDLHKLEDELFLDKNMDIKDGNIIHVAINNSVFVNSQNPVEVRFVIRTMLYLREREKSDEVANIVGIAGGFTRNAIERFEGSQLIKMSVEEFEELYKEANVADLDTKRQIDVLTDLWVSKTGYWRRGLFGKEEK